MVRSIKEILEERKNKKMPRNIAHEFQDYGVRLAQDLGDQRRKAFYIKLAKECPRHILESAREYASGYSRAKSKAKIFMWFLTENNVFKKN